MDTLRNFWDDIVRFIPELVKAILLIALAWGLGYLVKKLIIKGGEKLRVPQILAKKRISSGVEAASNMLVAIGNLAFFIIVLLFIPAIFALLHIPMISVPFEGLLNDFARFVPNLIGAILIMYIGYLLAKVLRDIARSILAGLGVDKFSEKVKPGDEAFKLSNLISQLIFGLILFAVIVAALHILNIDSISAPLIAMLNTVVLYIPKIIAVAVVITLGVMIINFAAALLEGLIKGGAVDKLVKKSMIGESEQADSYIVLSTPLVLVAKAILIFLLVVESFEMLDLYVLSHVGREVIAYLPNLIGALAIVILGFVLANLCTKILRGLGVGSFGSVAIKAVIYILSVFMAISQLDIAKGMVEPVFIIVIAAVGIAFAVAFGLGGRDFAAKTLDDIRDKAKKDSNF